MANLLDKIKKSYQEAKADYAQLAEGYPNAKKFLEAVGQQVNQHIPSNEDFHDPEAMREWSQAAAMNAPMMGSIKWEGDNIPWSPANARNAQQAFRDKAFRKPYSETLRRFVPTKPEEVKSIQDKNKKLVTETITNRKKDSIKWEGDNIPWDSDKSRSVQKAFKMKKIQNEN